MKKFLISTIISLMVFCIPFVVYAGTTIDSLEVTLTGYKLGNTLADINVTTTNSNIEIVACNFSYGNSSTNMSEKEEFDGGYNYCALIFLKAKGDSVDLSSLTANKVKVNGEQANYFYKNNSNPYAGTYKIVRYLGEFKTDDYAVKVEGGTAKVNGKTITRAKPGDKVNISLDGGTSLGNKFFIKWWCSDYKLSTEETNFSFTMPKNMVSFEAIFGGLVKEITITDIVPPVAEKKPDYNLKYIEKDGIYFNDFNDRSGIRYITSVWEDAKTGDEVKDTFQYNSKYRLVITVVALSEEQFLIDKDIKNHITVDGKKVSLDNIDEVSELAVKFHLDFETEGGPEATPTPEPKEELYTYSVAIYEKTSGKSIGGKVSLKTDKGTEGLKSTGYSMQATKGTSVVFNAVEDNGYKFLGWYTKENDEEVRITEQKDLMLTATKDKTYVAVFEALTMHKVTFETNGGSKIDAQDISDKSKATKPNEPTKEGFEFDGWYIDKELTKGFNFLQEITEDITLYAKWVEAKKEPTKSPEPTKAVEATKVPVSTEQQEAKVVTYEVSFDTNGGSKIETLKVKSGDKIKKPADPSKEGYKFEGWFENKTLKWEYNFETPITESITLYAKWSEKSKDDTSKSTPATNILWTSASTWAIDELNKAKELGVIPDIFNKEDLTKDITRKEFAHVAVRLFEKLTKNKAVAVANNPFVDTNDTEVLKAFNTGITMGTSDTTFNPDDLITREQMATMMTRALTKAGIDTTIDLDKCARFSDDAEMNDWGRPSIYYMSSIDIIKGMGDGSFGVKGKATREQALLISVRSAEKLSTLS